MARQKNDFYETAPWQTRALLAHQPISGTVLEPCVGDWSIVRVLNDEAPAITGIITNDIDPQRSADFHFDAASPELWCEILKLGGVDWVVSNPPFLMPVCRDIVIQALKYARVGVAMMLPLSFREPTPKINPRGPFLEENPISRLLTLPRYSFTGNGKTYSMTTEWAIWIKHPKMTGAHIGEDGDPLPPVLSLYKADEKFAEPLFLA